MQQSYQTTTGFVTSKAASYLERGYEWLKTEALGLPVTQKRLEAANAANVTSPMLQYAIIALVAAGAIYAAKRL